MKNKIMLSKKDLDSALKSIKENDSDLYFSLGAGLQYEYAPPSVDYMAPYVEMGLELWLALSTEIYYLLCDPTNKRPKDWVQELITEDIRNLVTGIIAAIASTYNVSLGIAIPAAALVIKKGLVNYCKIKPRKKIKRTVKVILNKKKKSMEVEFKKNISTQAITLLNQKGRGGKTAFKRL